jgi:filamentous hemagglutinin family protein
MMKSTWGNYWTTTAIAIIAISPVLLSAPVTAQSITAAQDGTNTVVLPNGQRFDITGGTQAGANLFHSFQQFGLNQGQIANFLSQPNIQNILGRVVGGDPSVINGLIQLTGGNSNLYIMNPAGVIFGSNASLNVPASFTATTANGIQVGNGWFGMNTIASDLKNLTGTPNAFAFTSPITALTQNQTSGVIVNQGNLSVSQGKSITLVGGIVINTGTIESPNGNINIVAVPDGKYVRITPEGGVLSFDLAIATQQELGNTTLITGIDLPKLLTGSGIVAPSQQGTAIATGNLTAANINVLANRYDTTQASLNATNIQQGWNFVFIDSTIKNYQTLLDGTNGGSSVTMINPDQYGIAQVTATLATVTGANSLHIVSEGDVGNFWLGKDFVSTENIAKYANDLQAWKTSLSPAANILLYACNLAGGENGAALVQAVKNYTGHEVAASTDRTGSLALGGNWNLEYQTGTNPATVIFSNAATSAYQNTLAILTVLNTNDTGGGSLRNLIGGAFAGDTIRFDSTGLFSSPQIIALTSGELLINQNLTIQGTGANNLTISGSNTSRVINIAAGTVNIDGLTVADGRFSGGNGAGISVAAGATLNLSNSVIANNQIVTVNDGAGLANTGTTNLTNVTVRNNTANDDGGGIVNFGTLTIINSTLSNNTAIGSSSANSGGGALLNTTVGTATLINTTVSGNTAKVGGGIRNDGNLTILNSTVANNRATGGGGGIVNTVNPLIPSFGTLSIRNTIIATNIDISGANTPDLGNAGASGIVTDGGNNLIGNTASAGFPITFVASTLRNVNPQLAPLGNYGSTTQTHALLPNSPALNAGSNTGVTATDQRGAARIFGGTVDIGAFESQGFGLTPLTNTTPQSTNINTNFANFLGVQVTENFVNAAIPAPNILVTFAPSSSSANGVFAGNTSILTNQFGIALAPNFTANGISGSYSVAATANGFKPATFSLTNNVVGGFGGVYPSREELEGRSARLDEQDLEVSFTKFLCLDPSLATAKTTSIPTCKK